jgi:hypothetical protein
MGKRSREKWERRAEAPKPPRASAPDPIAGKPARLAVRASPPATLGDLVREHRVAIVVLYALALVVRGLLLAEIAGTPFFEVGNIDSVGYQKWATQIAEGAWWPAGTFYQSPLYAYFLATLYSIVGVGSWSPRVVQVVLGSASPVLAYAIATRLFTRRVGWIVGVALALYGRDARGDHLQQDVPAGRDVARGVAITRGGRRRAAARARGGGPALRHQRRRRRQDPAPRRARRLTPMMCEHLAREQRRDAARSGGRRRHCAAGRLEQRERRRLVRRSGTRLNLAVTTSARRPAAVSAGLRNTPVRGGRRARRGAGGRPAALPAESRATGRRRRRVDHAPSGEGADGRSSTAGNGYDLDNHHNARAHFRCCTSRRRSA